MRKTRKLKLQPKTLYICDRHVPSCVGSTICGNECKHTADINHAKYKTHNKFKRHVDGSMWEKEKDDVS